MLQNIPIPINWTIKTFAIQWQHCATPNTSNVKHILAAARAMYRDNQINRHSNCYVSRPIIVTVLWESPTMPRLGTTMRIRKPSWLSSTQKAEEQFAKEAFCTRGPRGGTRAGPRVEGRDAASTGPDRRILARSVHAHTHTSVIGPLTGAVQCDSKC